MKKNIAKEFNRRKRKSGETMSKRRKRITKQLNKRKSEIAKRLKKRNWENQPEPMLKGSNIHTYNTLAGGTALEDIKLLRRDQALLDALGTDIIPDSTTAGDFLRRFDEDAVIGLMEAKNTVRQRIWQQQPQVFKKEAVVNVDGTISETYGECKFGMDISYNGKWGCYRRFRMDPLGCFVWTRLGVA